MVMPIHKTPPDAINANFVHKESLAASPGDLCYLDSADSYKIKPASSLADQGSAALSQALFASLFAGMSLSQQLSSDATARGARLLVEGDVELTCDSTTFNPGDYVTITYTAGVLSNQNVTKTTDRTLAIAKVIRRYSSATTKVWVRFQSPVLSGLDMDAAGTSADITGVPGVAAGDNGGTATITGGAAAPHTTGTGGVGGTETSAGGVGGAATTGTGGAGGTGNVRGGVGGATSAGTGAGGAGGAATLIAGAGGNSFGGAAGAGGAVTITGGASGTGTAAAGGDVNITGGAANATNGAGGNVVIAGGAPNGTGTRGSISATGLIKKSSSAAAISAARVLTLSDSGGCFTVAKTSAYAITLPTPQQGLRYKFLVLDTGANAVTISDGANHFLGTVSINNVSTAMTGTTITLTATGSVGDWVEVEGISATQWHVTGACIAAADISIA